MKEYEFNVRVRYAETDQMGGLSWELCSVFWDGTRGMA
jgi:hypothetical protein